MSKQRSKAAITDGNPQLDALFRSANRRARKMSSTVASPANMGLTNLLGLTAKAADATDRARIMDFFANFAARTGYGSPNLVESAEYPLVRVTFDYWQLISLYEGGWIPRRIVDVPAQDMVRAWPKLSSDIDPKQLTKLDRVLRRTNSKNNLLQGMIWARLFGGAGCLMVIEGQEKELDKPLDLDSIPIGGFKGLIPFDRWSGIYPNTDWCTDITKPIDFNLPESYTVQATGGQGFRVHASRILRFTGPTVPTPEREAYSMWGISVIEPVLQELKKRDNVSWNIANLTFRANILGMKFPELAQALSGLGMSSTAAQSFEERMSAINHLISNQSLVPLPTDGGIESTSYSFSGLGEVYQQFCLDISGAAQIPVARLWGRTITGLGQTGDGDEKIYEERIATEQDAHLRPQLEKLYPVLCASELGEVPDDLDMLFPSIRVLDEKERSDLAKTTADTLMVYLNGGIMSPQTVAKEVQQSSDGTGIGTNLTSEAVAGLSDKVQSEGEMGEGLFGEGGESGLNPSSSPAKVIKAENKEGKSATSGNAELRPVSVDEAEEEEEPTSDRVLTASHLRGIARAADSDGAGILGGPRRKVHGLDVVIETPKGYERHGKGWRTIMTADYGYIVGYAGADGDSLDCYVGPKPSSDWVYCVDQAVLGDRRKFDETKVMLGFDSQGAALRTYRANHHKAADIYLDFTPMHINDFKEWLTSRNPRKPCSTEVY